MGNISKPLQAFIIKADEKPVGYIQHYRLRDFPREEGGSLENPSFLHDASPNLSLGSFDMFIGEEPALNKGIGSAALALFMERHLKNYTALFVDPQRENKAAIKTYTKAGFFPFMDSPSAGNIWMLRIHHLPSFMEAIIQSKNKSLRVLVYRYVIKNLYSDFEYRTLPEAEKTAMIQAHLGLGLAEEGENKGKAFLLKAIALAQKNLATPPSLAYWLQMAMGNWLRHYGSPEEAILFFEKAQTITITHKLSRSLYGLTSL